jgi:predicted ABC-type ATPase
MKHEPAGPPRAHLVVVGGPNGSGKTTFALEYAKTHRYPYIGADMIAERLKTGSIEDARLQAGRVFLAEVSAEIDGKGTFVVESTLSGLTLKRVLAKARKAGYDVSILFLYLGSADACVARIHERVLKGGHPVPERDVRRRFSRSIKNFWHDYRLLADRWHLLYNGGPQLSEVAHGELGTVEVRDEVFFKAFLRLAEE